jgi:hypothetical protein
MLLHMPWLWNARRDLLVFGGSAALGLGLVGLGHALGFGGGSLPEWAFLLLVLGVDVAHVYATLFRTYFDGAELRARPLRYLGVPLVAYAFGVLAYAAGPLLFWRALAYLALLHFVRQEIGCDWRVRAPARAASMRASRSSRCTWQRSIRCWSGTARRASGASRGSWPVISSRCPRCKPHCRCSRQRR